MTDHKSIKVEAFKSGQDPANALHTKFGLKSGEPVSSLEGYNHLQIDVVSLFLLFLVQTVSSGLKEPHKYDIRNCFLIFELLTFRIHPLCHSLCIYC